MTIVILILFFGLQNTNKVTFKAIGKSNKSIDFLSGVGIKISLEDERRNVCCSQK